MCTTKAIRYVLQWTRMFKVDKRVALITGAARGFGAHLVSGYLESGYHVVATARQIPIEDTREDVSWRRLNVLDHDNCINVIKDVASDFSRIDVIVNNASAYNAGIPLQELSPEAITEEVDVTLRGAIFVSKAYVSSMRDQGYGTLIFISSTAALPHEPECGLACVYAAAKAGVVRFAESLQQDIEKFGLRTQVVIPGNMRECINGRELAIENSISYYVAARAVVALAENNGNLNPTHVVLRPEHPLTPA